MHEANRDLQDTPDFPEQTGTAAITLTPGPRS